MSSIVVLDRRIVRTNFSASKKPPLSARQESISSFSPYTGPECSKMISLSVAITHPKYPTELYTPPSVTIYNSDAICALIVGGILILIAFGFGP